MANQLLTIQMITVKALQLFLNTNAFLMSIDKQHQSQFGNMPLQIGSTLQIRKPIDPVVRFGPTASPQNTNEQQIPMSINSLIGVDLAFTETDMVLSLADFGNRIIRPSVNNLAGAVANWVMDGIETGGTAPTGDQQTANNGATSGGGGIPNIVNLTADGFNVSNSPTISPTQVSWLTAGAVLDKLSCPKEDRVAVLDPFTVKNTTSYFAGLFNPQPKISEMFDSGEMPMATLGVTRWLKDQTTLLHQTAAFGTLANVSGPNQTGSTITVAPLNGPLNVGDIISFTGVNSVNRVTKADNGVLATFVITVANATSDTSVHIYPPLNPAIASVAQSYQTVTVSPADGAPLLSPVQASQQYRKNFIFHPSMVTAAFIKLPENEPGTISKTESYDNVSLRVMRYFTPQTMTSAWRLDTLFGSLLQRPEWGCIVSDTAF